MKKEMKEQELAMLLNLLQQFGAQVFLRARERKTRKITIIEYVEKYIENELEKFN